MFLAESGKDGSPGCEGLLSKAQSDKGDVPQHTAAASQNFKAKMGKKLLTTFIIG